MKDLIHEPSYLPTPQQIKESCAEIQATWTPGVRESRYIGERPTAWRLPCVSADGFEEIVEECVEVLQEELSDDINALLREFYRGLSK